RGNPKGQSASRLPPTKASSAVPPTRVAASSKSTAACSRCGKSIDPSLPFCAHCGTSVAAEAKSSACPNCGATYVHGVERFCARCGARVGQRVSVSDASASTATTDAVTRGSGTQVLGSGSRGGPRLALLNDAGDVAKLFTLDRGEAVVGRGDADIRFPEDVY